MAPPAPRTWLVKEEPESYPYEQLVRDGKTSWAGVKNPLAQKHLRGIRRGDRILYYHTGKVKAIVGVAKAAGDAYPDPADKTGTAHVVDIVPDHPLPHPVTLAELLEREDPRRRCRVVDTERDGRDPLRGDAEQPDDVTA